MTTGKPMAKRGTARQALRIATWNINSVRLRLPLLHKLVADLAPDVICLQETKCPDEAFPHEGIAALGFAHRLVRGMKGYNGVAVLSRLPISLREDDPDWCAKGDCRHLGVMLDAPGGPIEVHNFYVPAGGDVPDREANPKFGHKLDFVGEATRWFAGRGARRAVLVGDLNYPKDRGHSEPALESAVCDAVLLCGGCGGAGPAVGAVWV
jgi:exodeoxyribonuclease-3